MATTRQSIEQARAKHAWDCADKNKKNSDYKAVIDKVPTYIKTNGLMNTLAFMYSKEKKHGLVFQQIIDWLTSKYGSLSDKKSDFEGKDAQEKFLAYLINETSASEQISITTEILALFNWMRRFAKS